MVIICPECSTKFRVNPERIPEQGTKVRCARCKHVFLAEKPAPVELEAPVAEVPIAEESVSASESLPATDTETQQFTADFGAPEVEDSGFSYDQFRELDTTQSDETDFTFSSSEEAEPAAVSEEEAEATESFRFSGPDDDQTEKGVEQSTTALDETESRETTTEEPSHTQPPETTQPEPETISEPVAQASTPTKAEAKSSSSSSVFRLLLLLLLGLVIIAGALYYVNGPEQINQVIQQIFGQQSKPAEKDRITLANLEGKFINNQDAGEIFVISGKVINNFREARASIQVKGVIFDPNGKPLLQKTIFCGNPISTQELQTLPFSKLEEMMRNQFGKAMNNMQVNHKEAIQFVIAFRDLPKDLSEFSVDIASSEPAAN